VDRREQDAERIAPRAGLEHTQPAAAKDPRDLARAEDADVGVVVVEVERAPHVRHVQALRPRKLHVHEAPGLELRRQRTQHVVAVREVLDDVREQQHVVAGIRDRCELEPREVQLEELVHRREVPLVVVIVAIAVDARVVAVREPALGDRRRVVPRSHVEQPERPRAVAAADLAEAIGQAQEVEHDHRLGRRAVRPPTPARGRRKRRSAFTRGAARSG
jgi:hypothetical protein